MSGSTGESPKNSSPRVARHPSKSSSQSLLGSLGKEASREANRRVAAILEVLGGFRTPSEAASALGISVSRYYLLERKALAGLLASCEQQPKGPREPSAEKRLAALERELESCRRECLRQAALVRATQRAVGLPTAPSLSKKKSGKTQGNVAPSKRRRRATVRALRAAETLRQNSSGENLAVALENRPETTVDARTIEKEQDGETQG